MPAILALVRWRQGDQKFKVILEYILNLMPPYGIKKYILELVSVPAAHTVSVPVVKSDLREEGGII